MREGERKRERERARERVSERERAIKLQSRKPMQSMKLMHHSYAALGSGLRLLLRCWRRVSSGGATDAACDAGKDSV